MVKSLKDKLNSLKEERKIKYVNFFNDGSVKTDEGYMTKWAKDPDNLAGITDTMESAARSYSYDGDFDRIDMKLLIGLVYDKESVNDDNTLKEGAEPLYDLVRYYTGSVYSYLDNEQNNKYDYYTCGVNRQGFIKYSDLIHECEKEGLNFMGPESFDFLKNLILSKVNFDVIVSADLRKDNEMKLERK